MFIKSIYVLILTYVWDEHLILWATENFKNSTFVGIYGERENMSKNLMMQLFVFYFINNFAKI